MIFFNFKNLILTLETFKNYLDVSWLKLLFEVSSFSGVFSVLFAEDVVEVLVLIQILISKIAKRLKRN